MVFTEKDWQEWQQRAARKRDAERVPYYRELAQAEVGAAQLTQHAAWNWFLQVLSAKKAVLEKDLAEIERASCVSNDFSHEMLARVQAARRAMRARIETYEEVMALPAQVVSDAKNAKQKLEALQEPNRAESKEKSRSSAAS
jgi:hypothetical protein